jgi:hypothetical protein
MGPQPTRQIAPQDPTRTTVWRRLILAEWTKLRSVPRWVVTILAAAALTILIALLTATASGSSEVPAGGSGSGAEGGLPGEGGLTEDGDIPDMDIPDGFPVDEVPPNDLADTVDRWEDQRSQDIIDEFHLVHQTLSGDGSITARVVNQEDSHEWAKAGLLLKERLEWGAPYAALMVTPDHGVRLQSQFSEDISGSDQTAPRWLRLTRSGGSVTGYESADGQDWSEVGTLELDDLPAEVEVGMFVTSPETIDVERQFGGESVTQEPTQGEATFDDVSLDPEEGSASDAAWTDHAGAFLGNSTESDGVFTVWGSGDIGERDTRRFEDGLVETTVRSVLVGMMAIIALGVLFITSEHKRGMIRTTLVAGPQRGRVLLAKAVVIGGVTFVVGLVASFMSYILAEPILRSNGFRPPEYPEEALSEPTVLRALVGTAALLAVIAVFSLGVGAIMRRSAVAITTVVALLVLPQIIQTGLPISTAQWLMRLTPSAGFAVQNTVERYDTAIGPLAGFGVLCVYAAAALGAGCWLLNRRDA